MTGPRWVDYVAVDEVLPAELNPKRHALADLRASVERFGFTEPPMLDERTGRLVAGHGRLETVAAFAAAQAAGAEPPEGIVVGDDGRWQIPVLRGWSSRDDAEASAYLVAANRLTDKGGWDSGSLVSLLAELDAGPGLAGVGYDADELAALLDSTAAAAAGSSGTSDPEQLDTPERVAAGDVWALGAHRLLCGDCRDAESVKRLLDGAAVNVAFTSPPYADRRKYDESSGFVPVPPDGYVEWFAPVAANVAEHLAPDGSWFVNIKAAADGLGTELYVFDLVLAHARLWGWNYATELCWERSGMPQQAIRRFKNGFEPVYQFTRGGWKFRPDNVRHRSDAAITPGGPGVGNTSWGDPDSNFTKQGEIGGEWFKQRITEGWAFPTNRLPTFAGSHEATGHMAAFPVGLPAFFARAYSDEGDTLLDPFAGSGSSLLAAEQENRIGFGVELSPGYCDVIVARWEHHHPDQPARKVSP